jgi:hypothetical protein
VALLAPGEVCGAPVRGNFKANTGEAARDAALNEIGIALLPTFAIRQEITSGHWSGSCRSGLPTARLGKASSRTSLPTGT